MTEEPRRRRAYSMVREALDDTRVVVVQGARQVGKTTLVRQVVEQRGGRFVTLDDERTRAAAEADPSGFLGLNRDGLLAVDEVQRVPRLYLALKLEVDRDTRPGRYLMTGSADLLRLPTMEDSLAGRVESIDLYGFSQGELLGGGDHLVDRLLNQESLLAHSSILTRADYLKIACRGGYPEAVARFSDRRRSTWFDSYVRRIVQRDASDISALQRIGELPKLLRLIAARNATELNVANLAGDSGFPGTTLGPYLDLLETLFLVRRIPAWSTNLTKRVVSRPKVVLLDSGLAAHLVNVSASGMAMGANPELAGQLLEGFVAGELLRQLTWSDAAAQLHHYRTYGGGAEVDLIVETTDGRILAFEVKASSNVGPRDVRWLTQLRDDMGSRFVAGVVLHTGRTSAPFGDRIMALPIDSLWS